MSSLLPNLALIFSLACLILGAWDYFKPAATMRGIVLMAVGIFAIANLLLFALVFESLSLHFVRPPIVVTSLVLVAVLLVMLLSRTSADGTGLKLIQKFPIALFFSGFASVLLVAVVGLLIGLMQFQSRLQRLQPVIGMPDLFYFVQTERSLKKNLADLASIVKTLSDYSSRKTRAENEVLTRVNRICQLLSEEGNQASAGVTNCGTFLRGIPFDHSGQSEPPEQSNRKQRQPQASGPPDGLREIVNQFHQYPAETGRLTKLSAETLQQIKAGFVAYMKDPALGTSKLSDVIGLYDLEAIAYANQELLLTHRPNFDEYSARYQTACEYQLFLIKALSSYREIDPGDCSKVGSKPQQPIILLGPGRAVEVVAPAPGGESATNNKVRAAVDRPFGTVAPEEVSQDTSQGAQRPPAGQTDRLPAAEAQPPSKNLSAPDKQRMFELVNSFTFYEGLAGRFIENVLLSPSDFLALLLVGCCGIMGALLRIVLSTYQSGNDPSARDFFVNPILGLICALVIYVLFRAGFIAITDQSQGADASTLSPFVIAILSTAAGLLSEQAIELFRSTSIKWFGSGVPGGNERWAVHLKRELAKHPDLSLPVLAKRLDVTEEKLQAWIDERAPVPFDKQRELMLVLNADPREIFSDMRPAATSQTA
jgi:hypothetical protein